MSYPNLINFGPCNREVSPGKEAPLEVSEKNGEIINNLSMHWPIVLKLDMLVHHGSRSPQDCQSPLPVKSKMAAGAQIRHIQIAITPPWIIRFSYNSVCELWVCGDNGIGEFVCWCIMGLSREQLARCRAASSCNASQLPPFL